MKFLQYMRHYSKSEIFDEQYLYFKRWFVQFLHNCVEDFLFVPNSVESFWVNVTYDVVIIADINIVWKKCKR